VPRGDVGASAAGGAPAESREVHVVQQTQLKILIIEDDDDQRELMRETLEDHFGVGTVSPSDVAIRLVNPTSMPTAARNG